MPEFRVLAATSRESDQEAVREHGITDYHEQPLYDTIIALLDRLPHGS